MCPTSQALLLSGLRPWVIFVEGDRLDDGRERERSAVVWGSMDRVVAKEDWLGCDVVKGVCLFFFEVGDGIKKRVEGTVITVDANFSPCLLQLARICPRRSQNPQHPFQFAFNLVHWSVSVLSFLSWTCLKIFFLCVCVFFGVC